MRKTERLAPPVEAQLPVRADMGVAVGQPVVGNIAQRRLIKQGHYALESIGSPVEVVDGHVGQGAVLAVDAAHHLVHHAARLGRVRTDQQEE